jgi:hypothetical protein
MVLIGINQSRLRSAMDKSNFRYHASVGLICCLFVMLSHGLIDAPLWGMVRAAPVFWMVMGFCLVIDSLSREDAEGGDE